MSRSRRAPSYRLHKPTQQAVVTIDGKDHYLGKHDTPESRQRYNELIALWYARGQQAAPSPAESDEITIGQLSLAYLRHCDQYYRRADGSPTGEPTIVRLALKPLNDLYFDLPVSEFGPMKLKAVREQMIIAGWVRTNINRQIRRIIRMFNWGGEQELCANTVHMALRCVSGLRRGRCTAKESEPVKPVPAAAVDAVLPLVSPQIRTMIELQRLTGMRPGEVCAMRTRDLDTRTRNNNGCWVYRPTQHKTLHHGHSRVIYLGPAAQQLLQPWLRADLDAPLFQPHEAVAAMMAERKANRQTPMTPSQEARAGRADRRRQRRAPGEAYTVGAYRRAIERACDQAFALPDHLQAAENAIKDWRHKRLYRDLPVRLADMDDAMRAQHEAVNAFRAAQRWHPHQLRHSVATELRAKYGIEAARVALGHRHLGATEIYAEADFARVAKIMSEVG